MCGKCYVSLVGADLQSGDTLALPHSQGRCWKVEALFKIAAAKQVNVSAVGATSNVPARCTDACELFGSRDSGDLMATNQKLETGSPTSIMVFDTFLWCKDWVKVQNSCRLSIEQRPKLMYHYNQCGKNPSPQTSVPQAENKKHTLLRNVQQFPRKSGNVQHQQTTASACHAAL